MLNSVNGKDEVPHLSLGGPGAISGESLKLAETAQYILPILLSDLAGALYGGY